MSLETSANPIGPQQASTVPTLRTFQTLQSSIDRISNDVNMFRGNISFPLSVLSLENRGGLKIDVSLAYQSDILHDVTTWNLEQPTSIVGLGWQMPYAHIELDMAGSVSPYDDSYYLATTDGARSQLFVTSKTADLWTFEAENFDFSVITYQPGKELWTVLDAGGQKRIFGADVQNGGSSAALRYAIKWGGKTGNWSDSSVEPNQSHVVVAWNLASVQNAWGEEITFTYTQFPDDEIQIGAGLTYTRSVYLATIADPSGRIVTFHYLPKLYTDTIREYQTPHVPPGGLGPYAYQDRYETRFLDSILLEQMVSGSAQELFTIRLDYTVDNFVSPGTPGDPSLLYKRYLRGLTTVNANGKILPGLRFDYYAASDASTHTGALSNVTYPDGGVATYNYTLQEVLSTSLDRTMTSSDPDWIPGVPRFWFGPDYIVISHYDELNSYLLTVRVHDWNGQWLDATPITINLPAPLLASSLQVSQQQGFFSLSLQAGGDSAPGQLFTWAVRRTYGNYGVWVADALAMPQLQTQTAQGYIATGSNFLIAAATGESEIFRYTFDPRSKAWLSSNFYVSTSAEGEWSFGARDNFFTMCQFQPGNQLALTLHFCDLATLAWTDKQTPLDGITQYVWQDNLPKLSWTLSDTFAAATYLTSADEGQNTFNYQVNVYLWDKEFEQLESPAPIVGLNIPADTVEPVYLSLADASLIGNVGNLMRYNGSTWVTADMGSFTQGSDVAQFAFGNDLAVGVDDAQGTIASYNPYTSAFEQLALAAGSGGPATPTINTPFVTVRNQIYQQMANGALTLLNQTLPLDAVIVSNQAPTFFAYGLQDGTSFVWVIRNGVLDAQASQIAGSIFPPSSSGLPPLAGPFAFATWSGASYEQADTLTLNRVLTGPYSGPVSSFVATSVALADGMGNSAMATFDYQTPGATGTVSPFGLSTQFSQVKSVLGAEQNNGAPFGYSLHSFYDGLPPENADPHILYSFLAGMLSQVDGFNSAGTQVAKTTRTWETPQTRIDPLTGQPLRLIGAYTRLKQSTETLYDVDPSGTTAQPPLNVPTVLTYNDANGRVRTRQTQFFDAATNALVLVKDHFLFAYEQYPAMAGPTVNQLVSVAQETTVSGATVTSISATTWTNTNPASAWAAYRRFDALSGSAVLSSSDWANTTFPNPSDWRCQWQVTTRGNSGEVREYIAADGLTNSIVTDRSGQLTLAAIGNASAGKQQALYLGFEPYEVLTGWTLAGSEATLAAAIVPGDSYTGSQALVLAGSGNANSSPLSRALSITDPIARPYVLSCWVKTPQGFSSLPGTAEWSVSGAASGSLPVPETDGVWQYVFLLVDLPALSAQALTLSLANTKAAQVLVDNIRFSPVLSGFTSTVFDPALLLATATMQSNGATSWTPRGDFNEFLADVTTGLVPSTLSDAFLSRRANGGVFSASQPNSRLDLKVRGWGSFQRFNDGPLFASGLWSSADPTQWTTGDCVLQHAAGAESTILFNGFPAKTSAAVPMFGGSVRVQPAAPLTSPLGLQLASGERLQWSPSIAGWTLLDSSGSAVVTAPVRSLLACSFATYSAQLNQAQLPAAFPALFSSAGLPLSATSTVTAVTANAQWLVKDGASNIVYYLVDASGAGNIQVVVFPRQWTFCVLGNLIALWADGGLVFSYNPASSVTPGAAFFATDAVGFDNALFFNDAQIALNFIDADSHVMQQQVATPTTSNPLQLVATATFYDSAGRDVIKSQGTFLTPSATSWGTYDAAVASFDWQTLAMTGLVATANPDSGSYPYWRTRFEDSPLARKVESGLPGASYAIPAGTAQGHTTRYAYGLNAGQWGFAAGKYSTNTTIDPDGRVQTQITDERRLVVASASLRSGTGSSAQWDVTTLTYSAAGLLTNSTSPMGWSDAFAYDFLGNAISASRANEGTVLSMYDSCNRLRFQQDARGAQSPTYIKYWKYDALSRVTEEGCSLQAWPGDLAANVDVPGFPAATPSNQYTYDFMQQPVGEPLSLNALGKLTQTICGNEVPAPGDANPFQSTESLFYDINGMTTQQTLALAGNATIYTTAYTYNTQKEILAISYPGTNGLQVGYTLDAIGRVTGITTGGNQTVAYTYNQNGAIATESMYTQAGVQVGATRSVLYAPPGWMAQTSGTSFTETTLYATTVGAAIPAYNGSPSQATIAPRASRPQTNLSYTYDPNGRLMGVTHNTAAQSFTYDTNGNLQQVAAVTNTYTAATQDEVQTTTGLSAPLDYSYDASGETTARTSTLDPANLTITWDCFRNLPLTTTLGTSSQSTLVANYGSRGKRLQKTFTTPAGVPLTRLYLRGGGDDALVELPSSGDAYQYVFGPTGLCYFRAGTTEYFVAKDRLRSVRAILDSSANLVGGYDYTPYGMLDGSALGSNPLILPYLYLGRELDETQFYDLRARAYDPLQGRFLSPDPRHQYISPYIYGNNNPLLFSDPNGEFAFLIPLFVAIGEAISAAVATITSAAAVIAETAAWGAAVGFGIGVIQGVETIATHGLTGAEAAGAFFGTVVLSTVGGALSGAAGAVTGAFTKTAVMTAASLAVGVVAQGGISAAQAAAEAALVGDDPGDAAWKNAIAGGTSFLGGSLTSAGLGKVLSRSAYEGLEVTTKSVIRGIGSGAVGGALGGSVTAALNQDTGDIGLSDVLQGIAFGVLGGIMPEVIAGRAEHRAELRRTRNSEYSPLLQEGIQMVQYGTF